MADRTVKVTLKANVADFKAQMKQATTSLEEAVKKADKTGQVADTALGRMTQRATLMGPQMTAAGTAVAGMGAALLGIGGMAIKTAADFDQAMSQVQAATHAPTGEMERLRAAAMKAGADTAFSATEAAAGIEELSKAGVSTADVLGGGLDGALALAAAGGVSVADAAETAATALTQFKVRGSDVTHVADLLAAGAGKAQGGVSDLSQALNQGGLVASQMGLSIEETVGGLSAFASAGLIGSDAGTSFKTMLQRLSNPSKEAAGLMKDLGINVYDSQGKFVGLAAVAGQLHDKMGSLSDAERNAAMSTIFGADAVRAASVLYDQGAEGIQGWIDAVNDSGYAAETAALMQDNLKGRLEQLGGSVETLMIKMGEGSQGPLMGLVGWATDMVNTFSRLPGPVQQGATALAMAGGAALTAVGGFMVIVPKIAETKAAMDSLGISFKGGIERMRGMSRGAKVAAGALTAIGVAAKVGGELIEAGFEKGAASADTMAKSIQGGADATKLVNDALGDLHFAGTIPFTKGAKAADEFGKAVAYAADPGKLNEFGQTVASVVGVENVTDLGQFRTQFEKLGQALASLDASQAAETFQDLNDKAGGTRETAQQLLDIMPAYKDQLRQVAASAGMATDDQTLLAIALGEVDPAAVGAGKAAGQAGDGMDDMGDAAQDAQEQIDELTDSLSKLQGLVLSEREAQRGFQEAIKAASDAVAARRL